MSDTGRPKKFNTGRLFHQPANDDLDYLLAGGPEETAERAAERDLPQRHLPLEAIAPDPQQLRHLPHPDELVRLSDAGDQAAARLLAGLRELGQSMQQQGQLQPAIVYADSDSKNSGGTHRLLHGQRRWSAALLAGLPTLWVVEVERPSELARLQRQFEENERRENFSDMERAWALVTIKEALQKEQGSDVPWGLVEQGMHISTQRRQDLLRLLRFSSHDQALIARYGWSEWVLRPLHQAIQRGELSQDDATTILQRLLSQPEVSTAAVTLAVEQYRQDAQQEQAPATNDGAGDLSTLNAVVARASARLRRSIDQLQRALPPATDAAARSALRLELEDLRARLDTVLTELQGSPER